jgi:hypothetical protein
VDTQNREVPGDPKRSPELPASGGGPDDIALMPSTSPDAPVPFGAAYQSIDFREDGWTYVCNAGAGCACVRGWWVGAKCSQTLPLGSCKTVDNRVSALRTVTPDVDVAVILRGVHCACNHWLRNGVVAWIRLSAPAHTHTHTSRERESVCVCVCVCYLSHTTTPRRTSSTLTLALLAILSNTSDNEPCLLSFAHGTECAIP